MSDPNASTDGDGLAPAPNPEPDPGSEPAPPDKPPPETPPPEKPPPDGRRRPKPFAIVAVVLVALLAVLGARETWVVKEDPAFCATACHHDRAPGGKTHEGHERTPCQKCHTTRVSTGFSLLVDAWITKSDHPRKHGKVESADCEGCHSQTTQWTLVSETQGHRDHRGVKGTTCLSCHGFAAHSGQPIEASCKSCHEDGKLHKPETENAETCLSCHTFGSPPEAGREPTVLACGKCHVDPDSAGETADDGVPMKPVDEHALHGGVACQLCHNAHGKALRPPAGQPVCARCHQIQIFTAGRVVREPPEGHKNCEQCHQPHAPLESAIDTCKGCHAKNAGTLAGANLVPAGVGSPPPGNAHPAPGTKPGLAVALPGQKSPSTALKHQSCSSCHQPHMWRAEPSGCKTCHADNAQQIQTRSPPEHGSCTTCHEVHGPPPTGAVCLNCHAKTKGKHVSLAPERHKDCTACHNPHAPRAADTRTACAKCHVNELAQASREGPVGHVSKNACLSCHKPHESPLPKANLCAQCHANKNVLVAMAAPSAHKECGSCHQQHAFTVKNPQAACARCHGSSGTAKGLNGALVMNFEAGPHNGPCKTCHVSHGTQPVARAECLKCHAPIEAAFKPINEKHGACGSCHEPHSPAKKAPARCATCHQAKVTLAASWPSDSGHAGECSGCHQPHNASSKKACGDCHANELASALGGKHQCTQCHAPHKETPGRKAAWWSRCSECHEKQTVSVKELGPKHSDCKNCHQPHKFSPPTCKSCHSDNSKLLGLHVVKGHDQDCESCHDPHTKEAPDRSKCAGCHHDRQDHQRSTNLCYGCHVFK